MAVPYFELISKDLAQANHEIQVLFTHILQSLYVKSDLDFTSFDILFKSTSVNNQIYKAQVGLFLIVRKIGDNESDVNNFVEDAFSNIKKEMEEKHYKLHVFSEEESYAQFEDSLNDINAEKVLSIAKKEKAVSMPSLGNMIYYNDVIDPNENNNISSLINTLAFNPDSAVLVQLIPTKYSTDERLAVEQVRAFLAQYESQMRYGYGLHVDSNSQKIIDAYEYYVDAASVDNFSYNILVYSNARNAVDVANKVIEAIETEDGVGTTSLEIDDVSNFDLDIAKSFMSSPWINSSILVNQAREESFWGSKNAPTNYKRIKFLMTIYEIRGIFKFPIDDNALVGIEKTTTSISHEKLHKSVISEGNFKIGIIDGTDAHAGIDLNDFAKHGLIVGMPGSGKTNFSLGLLIQLWKKFSIPFLAIEPTKSEYRSLIDEIPELNVFTPGKNKVSPFIINPFLPPTGVTVENYVPSLMSAFEVAFNLTEPLPNIFLSAINDCYNEYGWKKDSTKDDPTVKRFGMYEFIRVFKRKVKSLGYEGEIKSNIESAGVVRLSSLIEQNSNIYDTVNTIPLEDIMTKPTVIELNAINNKEQKSLLMALLLIMICVYTKNNIAGDGNLKRVMLIDEAHVILSNTSAAYSTSDLQNATIETVEDMIAEVRSYGTGIIIADQSPTKIGRNIIANTNVKTIFKLVEKENKDSIATAINMNEADYEELGKLGVGKAFVHHGKIDKPLLISTYDVKKEYSIRQVIGDDEIASLSTYWNGNRNLLIPYIECERNGLCEDSCDMNVRTNADFLASRLVSNYLPKIKDREQFIRFLVQIDTQIEDILSKNPSIESSQKLVNCTKIKFLRKALLAKDFNISNEDYEKILHNKHFIVSED